VQRKPTDTGAARTRECGTFPCIPKARANPSHLLSGPFPKGDALRDGGGHGASELGRVVEQGIIACDHGGVDACLQVSQPTQHTDDPPTDLLEDRGNVRIAGRFALEKARRAALVGPIKIDPLQEDKRHITPHLTTNVYVRVRDERLAGLVEQVGTALVPIARHARRMHDGITRTDHASVVSGDKGNAEGGI
jgi:hypothetical protein